MIKERNYVPGTGVRRHARTTVLWADLSVGILTDARARIVRKISD
jgi:hypothetical protein